MALTFNSLNINIIDETFDIVLAGILLLICWILHYIALVIQVYLLRSNSCLQGLIWIHV